MFTPKVNRIEYGGVELGFEEIKALFDVVLSQGAKRWTIGPESIAFEKELAEKTGVKYATVVNSGSSALLVGITALHLPKGSKVIIPALNFPTAYSSLLQNGLMPVVVDCDPTTLNLSLSEVKKAIEMFPDIKAVVAVHIAGNLVDLIKLREIVGERIIISDNCDGYGGTLRNKFIDTYSDISAVSFHAAHIISMGEGGAVLTDNEEVNKRAHKIREWGRASGSDTITKHEGFPPDYKERYVFDEIGYNVKPLELQCAMGRVQLTRLDDFKARREANHKMMTEKLKDIKLFSIIKKDAEEADNCWFSFAFLTEDRPRVIKTFEDNNIECRTIFSGNILRHPAYRNEPHIQIGDLKNSEMVMYKGMFLSSHPSLKPEMIDFISEVAHTL